MFQWGNVLLPVTLLLSATACSANLAAASAGLVGCPAEQITISNDNPGWGTRTWTASCGGRDFQCSYVQTGTVQGQNVSGYSGQVACAPMQSDAGEVAAPSETREKPAPKGAAGFEFGATLADTEKACTGANHQWTPGTKENSFVCSGTISEMEFQASAQLDFRSNKLTAATLLIQPSEDTAAAFDKLKKALRGKYGEPRKTKGKVPPECSDHVSECLNDGRMTALLGWSWKSGETIVLFVGPPEGEKAPSVSVRYERAPVSTDGL